VRFGVRTRHRLSRPAPRTSRWGADVRTRRIRHRRSFIIGVAIGSGLATALGGGTAGAVTPVGPSITTVVSGLNAPRGVAFDGEGSLYSVQSGVIGQGPFGLTRSGMVSKYRRGSSTPLWTTTFESLFVTLNPAQPPDVLGPEGISARGQDCGREDGRQRNGDDGCTVRLIMSQSHDGIAKASQGAISTKDAGHLYALNPANGVPRDKSDVGDQQYRFTTVHQKLFPSDFPDSNPYGVLVTRGGRDERVRTFVADAGANTVSEVMPSGRTRVIAYIPNETVAPFRDATPTCIARGPDGMLYVATLNFVANLFVSGSGRSNVWRVNPNANFPTKPKLWATGLTTATACTFDRQGNFWATEMFQPTAGAPGDVVRIPFRHPTHLTRIGGGRLPLPGGIAQGPDGDMYVSIGSADPAPGAGAIVRIND
jgi:hypothetical protein